MLSERDFAFRRCAKRLKPNTVSREGNWTHYQNEQGEMNKYTGKQGSLKKILSHLQGKIMLLQQRWWLREDSNQYPRPVSRYKNIPKSNKQGLLLEEIRT